PLCFEHLTPCSFIVLASYYNYTLSLHDALPISAFIPTDAPRWYYWPLASAHIVIAFACHTGWSLAFGRLGRAASHPAVARGLERSEEHTSELQSRENLVCRLLLEKKNNNRNT